MATWNLVSKNAATWVNTLKNKMNDFLLKEDADFLLLETGDKIIIEPVRSWTLLNKS